jgi:tetratricopeptide (TPR) repeat protein
MSAITLSVCCCLFVVHTIYLVVRIGSFISILKSSMCSSSILVMVVAFGTIAFSGAFIFFPSKQAVLSHGTLILHAILNDDNDDDAIDMSIINNKMMGAGIRDKSILEREIELISRLDPDHADNNLDEYSDLHNQEVVVSELWAIWYGEKGPLNEQRLRNIEETLGDPSQWESAEQQYMDLINEHCRSDGESKLNLSKWVEPANRLATLLYLMGRLEESKAWCEAILEAKPWHIGALSGVVMVCVKLNDEDSAKKYISMGLPNLSTEKRNARRAWVERNLKIATEQLSQLQSSNAIYEKIDKAFSTEIFSIDDNSSSWQ